MVSTDILRKYEFHKRQNIGQQTNEILKIAPNVLIKEEIVFK